MQINSKLRAATTTAATLRQTWPATKCSLHELGSVLLLLNFVVAVVNGDVVTAVVVAVVIANGQTHTFFVLYGQF